MSNSESLATRGTCIAHITNRFDGDSFHFQVSDMEVPGYEYMDIRVGRAGRDFLIITLADEFSDGKEYEIRKDHFPIVKFNKTEAASGVIKFGGYNRETQTVHMIFDFVIGSGNEKLNMQGALGITGLSKFEVTEDMRARSLKHK